MKDNHPGLTQAIRAGRVRFVDKPIRAARSASPPPAVSGSKPRARITVPRTNSSAKASVASGPVQVDAAALYRSVEAASAYDYPRGPGVAYPSNLFPELERRAS